MTSRIRIAFCVVTAIALMSNESGAQAQPPERNRALIGIIDEFLRQPFQEAARTVILDSAEARPDVTITLSTAVMPAFCYKDEAESVRAFDALLLSAFVGGNMRAQLVAGEKGDNVEAGLRATLAIYKVIRARVPEYHVPEVNEWQAAESAGQLAVVADSLFRVTKECKKKAARFPKRAVLVPTPT